MTKWLVFLGILSSNVLAAEVGSQRDVSEYFINLRREKMQALKKELDEKGARVLSPDVDPNLFSGIKRLRILQAKASHQSPTVTVTKVEIIHSKTNVESPTSEVSFWEGIAGLSTGVSIAILIGIVIFVFLASFVVYKYMSWKPKMSARKGYRAVSRSRGLGSAEDSAAADSSDNNKSPPALLQAHTPGLLKSSSK